MQVKRTFCSNLTPCPKSSFYCNLQCFLHLLSTHLEPQNLQICAAPPPYTPPFHLPEKLPSVENAFRQCSVCCLVALLWVHELWTKWMQRPNTRQTGPPHSPTPSSPTPPSSRGGKTYLLQLLLGCFGPTFTFFWFMFELWTKWMQRPNTRQTGPPHSPKPSSPTPPFSTGGKLI